MRHSVMFHDGNRRLQDQFDSRRISDRLEEKLTRQAFTDQDRAFIAITPRNLKEDTHRVSDEVRELYKQVVGQDAPLGV